MRVQFAAPRYSRLTLRFDSAKWHVQRKTVGAPIRMPELEQGRQLEVESAWRSLLSLTRPRRPDGTAGPPGRSSFSLTISIDSALGPAS